MLEIQDLAETYPRGFLVRLHVLGDFYSAAYARLWHNLMDNFPQLHVFGFTARIDPDDPITQELVRIRKAHPDRWFMRFSDVDLDAMAAQVVGMPEHADPGFIVCPQQTGQTDACATCALCWHSTRNIAFLRH
jgi:hypothetical protein